MTPELLQQLELGFFYFFAAVCLGSALVVVGQRNPLHSAFALIVTLCSLSAIFGLLGSPFIAALQVVVYAGAIMVLFLFVLMLLRVQREEHEAGQGKILKIVAIGLGLLMAAQVGAVVAGLRLPADRPFDASSRSMARELFTPRFVYVFEATSILIVGALVGAVVLARKEQ
jgi:NADH-quinone oxidoreductase subunit J